MFFRNHIRKFHHSYIYTDERKIKIDEIKHKAAEELKMERGEYHSSRIKGFLTDRKYRQRISTTTAVLLIVTLILLWYFLIY